MNAACKKWVAAILAAAISGNAYAFPTYFAERIYRTWEQLDEALAASEITPEFYDESDYQVPLDSDTTDTGTIPADEYSATESHLPFGLRYTSRFVQDLDETQKWKKRDSFSYRTKPYSLSVEFEKGLEGAYSVRALSFSMRKASWSLSLGDFKPNYGSSLTVGGASSQSLLHTKSDLDENLLYPYANRENGIKLDYDAGPVKLSGFASRLRGASYFRESQATYLQLSPLVPAVESLGLTLLRQKIGQRVGPSTTFNYLAPHFLFRFKPWTLQGESSFQINGASAHSYEIESRTRNWSQSHLLFSYGKDYRNLESGGYAYSDYDDETIESILLTYRDKRAGRQGIAVEQAYRNDQIGMIAAQLVRWANRNDDRQCIAARLSHSYLHGSKGKRYFSLKTQAIWQDLDIVEGTDWRRLVTANAEYGTPESFTYECLLKIEQRVLKTSRKYPFRFRHDLNLRVSPKLSFLSTLNFYNSDISISGKSQLTVGIGQNITFGDNFGLSTRLQTRYCFASERCDNWEMRINFDLLL